MWKARFQLKKSSFGRGNYPPSSSSPGAPTKINFATSSLGGSGGTGQPFSSRLLLPLQECRGIGEKVKSVLVILLFSFHKGGTFFGPWFMHAQNKAHFSESSPTHGIWPGQEDRFCDDLDTATRRETWDQIPCLGGPLGRTSRLKTSSNCEISSKFSKNQLQNVKHNLKINWKSA